VSDVDPGGERADARESRIFVMTQTLVETVYEVTDAGVDISGRRDHA